MDNGLNFHLADARFEHPVMFYYLTVWNIPCAVANAWDKPCAG